MRENIESIVKHFNTYISIKNIIKLRFRGGPKSHIFLITDKENNKKYILKKIPNDYDVKVEKSAICTNILRNEGIYIIPEYYYSDQNNYTYKSKNGTTWEMETYIDGLNCKPLEINSKTAVSLAYQIGYIHKVFMEINDSVLNINFESEIDFINMIDDTQHLRTINYMNELLTYNIPAKDKLITEIYWEKYQQVRNEIFNNIRNLTKKKINKTLIHRDITFGNIIFDNNKENVTGIIDWDTVMLGANLQDVCYTIGHYLVDTRNKAHTIDLVSSFLKAYISTSDLSKYEILYIPEIVDLFLLRTTGWRTKNYLNSLKENKNEKPYYYVNVYKRKILYWVKKRDKIKNWLEYITNKL